MLILSLALGHLVITMAFPAHICFSHQRHLHVLRKQKPPSSNFPRIIENHRTHPVFGRGFFFGGGGNSDNDDNEPSENEDENTNSNSKNRLITTEDSDSSVHSSSPVTIGTGDKAPRPSPLLILPIERKPHFPNIHAIYALSHQPTIDKINHMIKKGGNSYVGLFLRRNKTKHSHKSHLDCVLNDISDIYHTGTLAHIQPFPNPIDGSEEKRFIFSTHRRINLKRLISNDPLPIGEVEHWDPLPQPTKSEVGMSKALSRELVDVLRDCVELSPIIREQMHAHFPRIEVSDPNILADVCAGLTESADGRELQDILEEKSVIERLRKVLFIMSAQREVYRLQVKISKEVEAKMTKQQREYLLKEQLKTIKKELGYEKDDKEALLQKFRERLDEAEDIPDAARKVIEEEIGKLEHLEKNSPEFNTSRNYLDWLTMLPWGKFTHDILDVDEAKRMLDEDHYGLEEVKERILEFIAVGKLRGALTGENAHGKILCMVGPPGVGKTSIAKSVANALGRKFYRFSVGGLSDVAEIKGHRRTYVGAMPGKVVMALKETQTNNPLILIDEIDKLGKGYQGDPASALLELLDPSQNYAFNDNFIDTPVDMSQALFLCTANVLDTIPGPLLDRMEIVRLSGYDMPEKVEIASKYLIPKAFIEAGLRKSNTTKTTSSKKKKDKENKDVKKEEVEEDDDEEEDAEKQSDHLNSIALALEKEAKKAIEEARKKLQSTISKGSNDSDSDDKIDDDFLINTKKEVQKKQKEINDLREEMKARAIPEEIASQINISKEAIWSLVRWYCREAGVRNLAQKIEKISRKLALDVVRYQEGGINATDTGAPKVGWTVTEDNLKDYVGKKVFNQDRLYEGQPPPGVVMGLAWTSMGGTNLYIEVSQIPGLPTNQNKTSHSCDDNETLTASGNLISTGQMGDVMKESTRIAYTFARNFLNYRCIGHQDNSFLATNQIHLHVPEGATPKDGPSAGVTMVILIHIHIHILRIETSIKTYCFAYAIYIVLHLNDNPPPSILFYSFLSKTLLSFFFFNPSQTHL